MKRLNRLLYAFVFTLVLASCHSGESADRDERKRGAKSDPVRVIVMGIDDTGSYDLWNQAKNVAVGAISQLHPGDIFYLRRIAEESYVDECSVFRLEIPKMTKSRTENPFDRKTNRQKKALEARINALKTEAIRRTRRLERKGASKTDIFGFLAVAGEKFSLAGKGAKPLVIIASDLQDNVRHKPELSLLGAQVVVVGFQVMKNPTKTQSLKKKWSGTLAQAGATHTTFTRTEEGFNLDHF